VAAMAGIPPTIEFFRKNRVHATRVLKMLTHVFIWPSGLTNDPNGVT